MNTQFLQEFICIAETKNFWEASAQLFMNQSTLSKHIRSLETELGTELFSRTTRRVELTNYGKTFLPYAKSMIQAEIEGIAAIQRMKDIEKGMVTIATIPVMSQYQITKLLAQFQEQYPDASFRITEDDSSVLHKYLENESCEFLFLREDRTSFEHHFLNNMAVRHIPYATDHMVVLMPKTHPLAGEKSLSLQQLRKERFCCIKEGSLIYQKCVEACRNAGFMPDIQFTSHRVDSILDMVLNSNCVALLMDKHLASYTEHVDSEELPWVVIELQPMIQSQVSLCYRTDKPLSEMAQKFVDFYTNRLIEGGLL